jgi:predicted nuclease of restriction endonuclease-like (RecB) superfamily
MENNLNFDSLLNSIKQADSSFKTNALKAVNVGLTLRNWIIGYHISEYELNGADRAKYGDNLLINLSKELKTFGVSSTGKRQLYNYHRFYNTYSHIVRTLPAQFQNLIGVGNADSEKVRTVSTQFENNPQEMILALSYSHFELLIAINDQMKRFFYEVEAMRGGWSVRELERQINSLYYERSGLSKNKKKLSELTHLKAEKETAELIIRDPYVFEFIGLKAKEIMSESNLEDELLDKIQDFLLEMGHGFCFEARQKRILIGDEHFFIDLVFYHRILKCHVIIELKLAKFKQENISQLNTYVNWFKKKMMTEGDNPPIGILLCTAKNHALVEFALAGMDNSLFVSKYQLELPKKEEMEKFILSQTR